MHPYKAIQIEIDSYLMNRFKYRRSLVHLTPDNIIATQRNNRIDLYLWIRRVQACSHPIA